MNATEQAEFDQMKAELDTLKESSVAAIVSARETEVDALLQNTPLAEQSAEVNLAEGDGTKVVQCSWKPLLVGMDPEQFAMAKGLITKGFANLSEGGEGDSLDFSEFDSTNEAGVELSEGKAPNIQQQIKAALRKRQTTLNANSGI